MKTRGTGVSHLVPNDPKKPAECNKIVDKHRPDFEQRFNPSAAALKGAKFFLSMQRRLDFLRAPTWVLARPARLNRLVASKRMHTPQ